MLSYFTVGSVTAKISENNIALNMRASTPELGYLGGVVTYKITIYNQNSETVTIDKVVIDLPSTPAAVTYVPGSFTSDWTTSSEYDVFQSNTTLSFLKEITLSAHTSAELSYKVQTKNNLKY